MRPWSIAVLVVVGAIAAYGITRPRSPDAGNGSGEPIATVIVPELEGLQIEGARVFAANCASCHGDNAAGREGIAPTLVHKIYRPRMHADFAFTRAVDIGVFAHHWRYGDMPPVEGLTPDETDAVIAYVRALQRANGIE